MVFVLTAKNMPTNASSILQDALLHVDHATDLAMDSHALRLQGNEKLNVRIAILHSRMSTVSNTTNLNNYLDNHENSKVYANSVISANNAGNGCLREGISINVGRPQQMKTYVKYAEVAIAGACLAIFNPLLWTNSTLCYKSIEGL